MRIRRKTKRVTARLGALAQDSQMATQADLIRKARTEAIGDIAAVLSHEARNLLGALGTCVQILRRNPHITGEDAELLDIIKTGSRRLSEIVSEFSAYGCPRSLHFQEVDLHELIEETLVVLQRDDRFSSSIFIRRQYDPSLHNIKADRDQLGQVFWNLFLNAVQAIGDQGQLWVETRRVGREIEILVQDTGPGIPAAVLPNIFEPLYSTKSDGIGLGLAIVRRTVEELGGHITVHSEHGTGTRFMMLLPVEPKDDPNQKPRKR